MTTKNNNENSDFKKYKKLFEKEKNTRESKNILWKNHPELVHDDKLFYTEEDKKLIKELLYNPLPLEYRSKYWYISTGAKLECKNNPGYYKKLVALIPKFKFHPHFETIELDKKRTFPDLFKEGDNSEKLANILKAFTIRNSPSIGYVQGFNYIAGQLLCIFQNEKDNEEKVFWCFTKIIEDYLPLNYYLNLKGVDAYANIVYTFIKKQISFLMQKDVLYSIFNALTYRCFSSLYSNISNLETLHNIWDVFFIYGDVILFRAFYFYVSVLHDKVNEYFKSETQLDKWTKEFMEIKPDDLLNYFLLMDKTINDSDIRELRNKVENKDFGERNVEAFADAKVDSKKCYINTPFCFYNEKIKKTDIYSEYKIFKLKGNTKKEENYLTQLFEDDKFAINNEKVIKNENFGDDDTLDNILVERVEHVCPEKNQEKN